MENEMILGLRKTKGINKEEFYNKYNCYIEDAFNIKELKDKNLLQSTTSGGIGDVICEQLIKDGYICVGVAYDYEADIAIGKIATTREETYSFRGSKYIQAYSYPAFQQILSSAKSQKIAFFGTPCQIFALDTYLKRKKIREHCILIDFYCHGCPSMLLWKKYINNVKEATQIKHFDYINFRDKSYGWGRYHIKAKYKSKTIYSSPKINDAFYTLFFSNQLLNNACFNCEIRNSLNYCDLRMGDFWGKHYLRNTSGMSLISINPVSNRGKKLFEAIKTRVASQKHNSQDCIPILWDSYSFKQKCYHVIKNIVLLMPNSIIAYIKSLRS